MVMPDYTQHSSGPTELFSTTRRKRFLGGSRPFARDFEHRRAQGAPGGTPPWLARRAAGGGPVPRLAIRRGPRVAGLAGGLGNPESRRSSGRLGQGVVLLAQQLPLGWP